MNQVIRFSLDISYDRYLSVYQGVSKTVRVKAEDGRVVDFPAGKVQPFLTKNGIQGVFEMVLSPQHKFIGIRKIG